MGTEVSRHAKQYYKNGKLNIQIYKEQLTTILPLKKKRKNFKMNLTIKSEIWMI